jgi:predicted ArsR family transcriptional regulator
MSRVCTICAHVERETIERAIVAQRSYRDIAGQFGVSDSAINRHLPHVLAAIMKEREDAQRNMAFDVLAQLKEVNDTTREILKECREADGEGKKHNGMALFAIDRLQKQWELQAKIAGILDERAKVEINIAISAEWIAVRSVLLQALMPYPDARLAVVAALQKSGAA